MVIIKKKKNQLLFRYLKKGRSYLLFFFIFESKTYPLVIFLPCEAIQNKSVFWVTTFQTKNLYCPVLFISVTLDKISYLSIIFNHTTWNLDICKFHSWHHHPVIWQLGNMWPNACSKWWLTLVLLCPYKAISWLVPGQISPSE